MAYVILCMMYKINSSYGGIIGGTVKIPTCRSIIFFVKIGKHRLRKEAGISSRDEKLDKSLTD